MGTVGSNKNVKSAKLVFSPNYQLSKETYGKLMNAVKQNTR